MTATNKKKKSKSVMPKAEDLDLHPDAWERFEKGVKSLGPKSQKEKPAKP
jgi:hypothetical protein